LDEEQQVKGFGKITIQTLITKTSWEKPNITKAYLVILKKGWTEEMTDDDQSKEGC